MKVLVACEESQRVCTAFRERGHEAYSCDIQEPSGGHPEWHILGDVLEVLNPKFYKDIHGFVEFGIQFDTMDDVQHIVKRWDLIIAHPPCTYLTNVATRHHSIKFTPLEKINRRTEQRIESMSFFMRFVNAGCDKIAIENPVGVMNTCYRKPDQIIHPYMFAESEDDTDNYVTKATCLWLKNLPPLVTNSLQKPNNREIFGVMPSGKAKTWEDSTSRRGAQKKREAKPFTALQKHSLNSGGVMMNLNQIDEAAYSNIDILPRLIDTIDKIYYLAMVSMYEAYRAGAIGKDEAAARKDQLRALHDRFDIDRKIYRQHQQIERRLGGYHRELETCGCEHCKKLIRLIDGRETPE